MAHPIKFKRKIMGNEDTMRVTIPKELAEALHWKPKQGIYLYRKNGGIMIEPFDEEPKTERN